MPKVGRLEFELSLDNRRFLAESQKSGSALRGIGKGARGLGQSLRKLASPIGVVTTALGALGAALSFNLIKRSVDSIASIGHLARNIGTTANSLKILERAANGAGVSVEEVFKGLPRFTRAIGEAVTKGVGPAKEAFDILGLSAEGLQNLDTHEQILRITESIDKLGLSASVNAKIMKDLGLDVRVFGTITRDNAAGLRQAAEEVAKYGLGLTEDDVRQATAASDALSLITDVFSRMRDQIAVELAPELKRFSDLLLNNPEILRETGRVFTSVFSGIGKILVGTLGLINGIQRAFAGVRVFGVEQVQKSVVALGKRIKELGLESKEFNEELAHDEFGPIQTARLSALKKQGELTVTFGELHRRISKNTQSDLQSEEEKLVALYNQRVKLAEVHQKSAEQQQAPQARAASAGGDAGAVGVPDGSVVAQGLQKQLDAVVRGLDTQREVEARSYMERSQILQAALENDRLTQGKYNEYKARLDQEYHAQVAALDQAAAETRLEKTEEQNAALLALDQERIDAGLIIQEQQAARLELLGETFLSEEERTQEHYARLLEAAEEYYSLRNEGEAEHNAALAEIRAAAADAEITAEYNKNRSLYGILTKNLNKSQKTVADNLKKGVAVAAQSNKAAFAIHKAARLAEATVAGYAAVQLALASVPPPFNIPVAAAQAALSAVQIANIASTSFGSRGTPSVGGGGAVSSGAGRGAGGGGGGSTSSVAPDAAAQPRSLSISITGINEAEYYRGDQFRRFAEALAEAGEEDGVGSQTITFGGA